MVPTPVIILTHNCLELTKKCVDSVLAQNVPVSVHVYDNASTDGTVEWLKTERPLVHVVPLTTNVGVSALWNSGLHDVFDGFCSHALVLNNDTILPTWFLRELATASVSTQCEFVTGISVNEMPTRPPERCEPDPHPDFSAFLIWREVFYRVGEFDETMKLYASDCDYHVRAHKLGIPMYKVNVPFYHERSSTMNLAPAAERHEIRKQADRDRAVFKAKWGCLPGTPEYEALFSEPEIEKCIACGKQALKSSMFETPMGFFLCADATACVSRFQQPTT